MTDEDVQEIKVGDVVWMEGSSALLGDVIDVDEDGFVKVTWRELTSTEDPNDLVVQPKEEA